MHTVSTDGIALIQSFESCRLTAYQDIAGIWTIGWGTTRINGRPVVAGMTLTQEQADALFHTDVNQVCVELDPLLTAPQSQSQIDALVCFCYNVGVGAFKGSTLRRIINAYGTVTEDLFTRWSKVRDPKTGELVTSAGLLRRRKAEYALYSRA